MASQWNRLFAFDAKPHRSSHKVARRRRYEQLEPRQMRHGDGLATANRGTLLTEPATSPAYAAIPVSSLGASGDLGPSITTTTSGLIVKPITLVDPKTLDQQMGLPMLDSNPGAPTTIYLDFDGNSESNWWYYDGAGRQQLEPAFTTPVFDTDGNTASFSAS